MINLQIARLFDFIFSKIKLHSYKRRCNIEEISKCQLCESFVQTLLEFKSPNNGIYWIAILCLCHSNVGITSEILLEVHDWTNEACKQNMMRVDQNKYFADLASTADIH